MNKQTTYIILAIVFLGGLYYYFTQVKTTEKPKPTSNLNGDGTTLDLNNGLELITSIVGLFGGNKDDVDTGVSDDSMDDDDLDDAYLATV